MGRGRKLICHHCDKEVNMYFGIGFFFPNFYKKIVNEISEGKYGEEWKQLYNSQEFVAVNAHDYLYYCKKCGHWEFATCMDLHEAKNPEYIRNKQYGIKTVAEWGEIPYVMDDDLKRDWKLIKAFSHDCPKCNEAMEWTNSDRDSIIDNLRCKDCRNKLEDNGIFMWD